MRIVKHVGVATVLLVLSITGLSQQLRLGKNPYALQKSAILELESDNQGMLFPRIADTTLINTMTPPDGMVIFFTGTKQLLLRSNDHWQPLMLANILNGYWSTEGNSNGSAKKLGSTDNFGLNFITNNIDRMLIDSAGNIGMGSSAFDATNREKLLVDAGATSSYNLISAKGSINNYLQLNIQNRSNGNTASSDIVATADNGTESVNYVDLGINSGGFNNPAYPILSGINNAYLYSTGNDFVIGNATAAKSLLFFTGGYASANERLRIDGNGNIGVGLTNPSALLHLRAGATAANKAPLKFTSGALMTTAEPGAVEFLTDKFYGTITTGAARKEFTLNDAALTAGRIPVATTNGRLTSNANLVWDNTNSRLGVRTVTPTAYLHLGTGTATAGTSPLKFTAGTSLTIPEAGAVEFNGTHFYITIGATRHQLDQQAGTTYTGSNGITLAGTDFRNNLITGLAGGQTVIGGTAANNALTLSSTSDMTKGGIFLGTSVYDEGNNRLGIGTTSPTEALDVAGSLKFNGALMPNNMAGTTGNVLSSNGAGLAPSWKNLGLADLSDATITAPATGQLLQYNGAKWANMTPSYLTAIDTVNISSFSQKVRGLFSAGPGISYNIATGLIGNSGVVSLNGNTGALTMDTGYISNFYLKSRGLLSGGSGITYNATTGAISSSLNTASFWNLAGNAGTTPASQFIGTTDLQDLVFRTNNAERMRLDMNGRLGIGTTSPATALHVSGTNPLTLTGLQSGDAADSLLTINASGTVRRRKVADIVNGAFLSSLNGLTTSIQSYATGSTGTDFTIASSGSTHTFNIPSASATARGVITTGAQVIAGSKTFSSAPLFSSLTPGSIPFAGAGGLLSQNNAALFWDAANNRMGLNTNTPGSDLTLFQSAGIAAPSKGFRFTGNSVGGTNSGTGFAMSLGYNIPNNKQLWLGDADYLGNAAGVFVRYSSSTGMTIMDAIDGVNINRKPLSLGVGGDPNSGIILGSDGNSISPDSYVWANGNMAIGSNNRGSTAPVNGLAVQGSVGIGTSSLDAANPEKLVVDAGSTTSVNAIVAKGSIDSYLQFNIQNKSGGANASSDVVATANNGNETTNYIDMGINGSNYSSGVVGSANDAYLYNLGQNLLIGTGTAAKSLIFMTGGTTQATNERMRIDGNGNVGIGTTTPYSSARLDVNGAVKLGAKGTVEKNVISFEVSFASNTNVPGAAMNSLFSTFSPGSLETTITIPTSNTPTTTRASVSISPDQDLPSNVSIASARVSATSSVKIRFLNSGTGTQTIPSGLKLYVTITEF